MSIILDDHLIQMDNKTKVYCLVYYTSFVILLSVIWENIKDVWSKTNKRFFVKPINKTDNLTSKNIYILLFGQILICGIYICGLIIPSFYVPLPSDHIGNGVQIKTYYGKVDNQYNSNNSYISVLGDDNKIRKFNCVLFDFGKSYTCPKNKRENLLNKNIVIHYIPKFGYQKINILLSVDETPLPYTPLTYINEEKSHAEFSVALSDLQSDLQAFRIHIYFLLVALIILSIYLYRFIYFNLKNNTPSK